MLLRAQRLLAEIEHIKTSITLYFIWAWQHINYAAILMPIIKIHKFYCRYLCHLGAYLALWGALPLLICVSLH